MSKSKESQNSISKCPFCEIPCKNTWCEYYQKWIENENRKVQE